MSDQTVDPEISAGAAPAPAASTWVLQPSASRLEFAVKHFWGLMTVQGHFGTFVGQATVDPAGTTAASLTITSASVDTANPRRDKHLRSKDFFDVERHAAVSFATRDVTRRDDGGFHVVGDLTIREHSETLEFDAISTVAGADSVTVEGTVAVDRTRFGMRWSPLGVAASTATLSAHLAFARAGAD